MKHINYLLTISALAIVSAQAAAGQVPVRLAGTGSTSGPFAGGVDGAFTAKSVFRLLDSDFSNQGGSPNFPYELPPVNGKLQEGVYDTTTGVLQFLFTQAQSNFLPTYSAGTILLGGDVIIGTPGGGDSLFDTTPFGTTTAYGCESIAGFDSCGYVGVGTGAKPFDSAAIVLDPNTPTWMYGVLDVPLADIGSGEQTEGFHVNFETALTDPATSTEVVSTWTMVSVPLGASEWLFGSALIGLVAVRRTGLKRASTV